MTELRSQSQRYYSVTEVEERHTVVTDVEEDAIDEAAASALPPITNALVLQENLPPAVLAKLRKELAFLEGYVWFSEQNVNRAAKCCIAAVSHSQSFASPGKPKEYKFFIDQIVNVHRRDIDMYHLDRAVKAVEINGTGIAAKKYEDIPQSIRRAHEDYRLVKHEFTWTAPVPDRVIDAVADFAIQTPPDEFWIAEYVRTRVSYDPIIYAKFGDWHVEVARWD